MVIKFVCPNGHPLSAGDDLAGKPGKCPKCQSMFLVPEAAPVKSAPAASAPDAPAEGNIAFVCPNGHKLSGPRSLQGKAGQCPQCGAKFRIPNEEESTKPSAAPRWKMDNDEDIPVGEMVDDHGTAESVQDVEPVDESPGAEEEELDEADLLPSPPPADVHPLAQICARLWRLGKEGVEIVYGQNQILEAEFFSLDLSQGEIGVFAFRNPGGDFTITAIPWREVQRLSIRKLKDLPQELFAPKAR